MEEEAKIWDEELVNLIGHEDSFEVMVEIYTRILAQSLLFLQSKGK